MKNKLLLLLIGSFVFLLSSCLNSDDDTTEYDLTNCQIVSFSLANDSVSGVSSVKFIIDQINGTIYNADSMAYGTALNWKLVTTLSLASSYAYAQIMPEATNDTINYSASDSIDYSKPVRIIVHSADGFTKKTYRVSLNIHQVNPDSMVWNKVSSFPALAIEEQKTISKGDLYYIYLKTNGGYKLYTSPQTTPFAWAEVALNGLPANGVLLSQLTEYQNMLYVPTEDGKIYQSSDGKIWSSTSQTYSVKSLLGSFLSGIDKSPLISAIIKDSNGLRFAAMNANKEWITGESVPAGFPVTGFGSLPYESMYYQRLLLVAGEDKNGAYLSSAWSTLDGLSWVLQTDDQLPPFEVRTGASVTTYDQKIYLIGGITSSNQASKDIYISKDKGITWAVSDTLIQMPSDFTARGFSSVIVDKDNHMLLFGGKVSKGVPDLNEIWQGRINRLGFKE